MTEVEDFGGRMTDIERFNACMQLANFGAGRHDNRRKYEWKITISRWALIVAAIANQKGIPDPIQLPFVEKRISLGVLAVAIILALAFLWLRGVWVANERDKRLAFYFRDQAREILQDANHKVGNVPGNVTKPRWCLGFYLIGRCCFNC